MGADLHGQFPSHAKAPPAPRSVEGLMPAWLPPTLLQPCEVSSAGAGQGPPGPGESELLQGPVPEAEAAGGRRGWGCRACPLPWSRRRTGWQRASTLVSALVLGQPDCPQHPGQPPSSSVQPPSRDLRGAPLGLLAKAEPKTLHLVTQLDSRPPFLRRRQCRGAWVSRRLPLIICLWVPPSHLPSPRLPVGIQPWAEEGWASSEPPLASVQGRAQGGPAAAQTCLSPSSPGAESERRQVPGDHSWEKGW